MRPNKLRQIWADGGAVVNGWLAIPSSFSAETMAHQNWDSLTVDMQHGINDYTSLVPMLTAISTTDVVPLVRAPWLEPGIIMKSLDAGAYGVICPMVSNGDDAERLVSYCRYPPKGNRSFGPVRATLYSGADYWQHANDTVVPFAMIETAEALEKLDEIMSVEGLDAIYVGPADLALAVGCKPGFDPEEKAVVDAIELICATAKRHGVVPGIHCGSTRYAKRMIELGFQFVTLLGDARLMAMKSAELLSEMRETTAAGGGSSTY